MKKHVFILAIVSLILFATGAHAFTAGCGIKSVQYGTVTIANSASSGTATITSVDTDRAVLHYLGHTFDETIVDPNNFLARITLTNATTVTATRADTGYEIVVGFVVVEYY